MRKIVLMLFMILGLNSFSDEVNPLFKMLGIEPVNTLEERIEELKAEVELTSFEKLVKEVCLDLEEDYLDILAIAHIESRVNNIIGDKHLANKAYGYFQIRQIAVDEVNRVFGFKGIKNASSLINNERKQVEYACYMIKYLKSNFKTKKQYITAYNMGIGSVKKGKTNGYYNKFLKARANLSV